MIDLLNEYNCSQSPNWLLAITDSGTTAIHTAIRQIITAETFLNLFMIIPNLSNICVSLNSKTICSYGSCLLYYVTVEVQSGKCEGDYIGVFYTRLISAKMEIRYGIAFCEKEKAVSIAKSMKNRRIDMVKLDPVQREDIETLWKMQVEAFSDLLGKYRDFELSPAAESIDKVIARFEQPWTRYFFIIAGGEKVGAVRVVDKQDGSRKRISPIWIMAEYRNKGYAQQAIEEVERIYGPENWCLDTILQEVGDLHLYEKMGYHRTGKVEHVNDRMDIVFFEKD